MSIENMDIEQLAKAIQVDAGEALPDLRTALEEAKAIIGRKADNAKPADMLPFLDNAGAEDPPEGDEIQSP